MSQPRRVLGLAAEHPFDVEGMGPGVAQPIGSDAPPLDRPVEPGDLLVAFHAGERLDDLCPRLAPPLDDVLGTHGVGSGCAARRATGSGPSAMRAVQHLAPAVERVARQFLVGGQVCHQVLDRGAVAGLHRPVSDRGALQELVEGLLLRDQIGKDVTHDPQL